MFGFKASIRTWLLALVLMSIVPPAIFSLLVVGDLARSREEILGSDVVHRSEDIAMAAGLELQRLVTVSDFIGRSERLRAGQMDAFRAETLRSLSAVPELVAVRVYDLEGRVLADTAAAPGEAPRALRDADLIGHVLRVSRPVLSVPSTPGSGAQLTLAVPVPVRGRPTQVVLAVVRATLFADLLQRHKLSRSWQATLADASGTIIAQWPAEAVPGAPVAEPLARLIRAGKNGLAEPEDAAAGEARIAIAPVPDWPVVAVVAVPESLLYQPLHNWLLAIAIVGLGALAGAVAWALWLATRVASRIADTSLASQALREGRSPDLRTSHIRELDEMADTLAVVSHLQAELRASEEKQRLVADSTSDVIGRLDLEGRYLYLSAAVRRLYGYNESELLGRAALDYVHPEDVATVKEALERVATTGQSETVRFRRRHRSGHYIWIETAVSAMSAEDGGVSELVVASRDITAQQQAAVRLREDEGRHRAVMESAADAILLTDEQGRYVDANPVALVMTGYPIEELRQLSINDLVAERDRGRLPEHLDAIRRGERRLSDWWMRRKNATEFLAEFSSLRLPDGRLLFVGRDVSSRREAEARMLLAASVFSETNQGIIITDAAANILDANPAFCTMMGCRREAILGRNPRFLQSGYHNADFYASLWQALASEGRWQGEMWNRSADGGVHPQQVTISAIRDSSGRVGRYLAVYADISELKREQQKVEHLAYHDALTKLPNRLLLDDRLQRALALAARNGSQVVVCYLDLDGFKPVNDRYGHKAGDIVLRRVAQCLEEGVRGHDTAARLGGDEFVVVLCEVRSQSEWYPVIERLQAAIGEPCAIDTEHRVTVTASVGVAVFPEDGADADALLLAADQALYRAKRGGRNRIELASETENPPSGA